ncbi:MAG: YHYH domain-containing protein [Gammaproteobacteria bacterium]|nr:YHYH domain-containing protein [Gammaproteobacteria bacterium]MDH5727954.1 YHYH domain-containing protein [Gammaproteobacteria bacterium]
MKLFFQLHSPWYNTILLFSLLVFASATHAHSGRTDSNGCHKDSKTGTTHCHNSGSLTSNKSSAPSFSYADPNESEYVEFSLLYLPTKACSFGVFLGIEGSYGLKGQCFRPLQNSFRFYLPVKAGYSKHSDGYIDIGIGISKKIFADFHAGAEYDLKSQAMLVLMYEYK